MQQFLMQDVARQVGFNVKLEERSGLLPTVWGHIPKDCSETCHYNFDPLRRRWLPLFGTPRGIIWMGTWRILHPRRILHAPGAISLHGSFCQVSLELGPSGQELRTLPTGLLRALEAQQILYSTHLQEIKFIQLTCTYLARGFCCALLF